ncbi:hypothetical protein [uncultured Pseudoteredinibacter sp.]|uniref:hypothetical protein n=1 Tax=uncultured Pseudoteredinibacter sp. TaxID=1641701 RepID=UPI0026254742|nr:hypothetical protein [uncultured Pseudoteredinibacter sp.]
MLTKSFNSYWAVSLDALCLLLSGAHIFAVLVSFYQGHYIIPSVLCASATLLYITGKAGLAGQLWAKKILFIATVLICLHLFFSLFHAATPRLYFGEYFYPVYSSVLAILLVLLLGYKRGNPQIKFL